MARWIELVTLGAALLAAAGSVFAAWQTALLRRPQFRIELLAEKHDDGALGLTIKLVSTGSVPVPVKKVFLSRRRPFKAAVDVDIWTKTNYRPFPATLRAWEAVTFPVADEALRKALVEKAFTVVAETEQGLRVQQRGAFLRHHAAQLQAALAANQARKSAANKGYQG